MQRVQVGKPTSPCLFLVLPALLFATCAFAAAPPPDNVVLLGSSSMNGPLGRGLEREFESRGLKVVRHGVGAGGLARPDFFDWMAEAQRVPVTQRTRAAIVYLGGNDAQGIWLRPDERTGKGRRSEWVVYNDPRWQKIYQKRARRLVEALCKRGAQGVIWITPVDVGNAWLQKRLLRIRDLQKAGVVAAKCGKVVAGTGDAAALGRPGHGLRASDGVHMTHKGMTVLWERIGPKILELLELDKDAPS